jgi:hypothetical protein
MTSIRKKEEEIQQCAKGVTPEELAKIRERAGEIAMNQGRPAAEPSEEDWQRAEREFLCLQTSPAWDEKVDRATKKAEACRCNE